ncbi:MAG: glutamate--tRNA ligase [Lactobacillales bacterium]|nr:glutamate--tRNA ligase [Lactobacillales bacterium]
MTPEIISKLFPNPVLSIADIQAKYPPRALKEGQKVSRVGPSPTGFMHLGTVYASLMPERLAHQSGGIFMLRIEDTDQKRKLEGATEIIASSLEYFGIRPDEGVDVNGKDYGAYGPYTQSERRDIYTAYAKHFVESGMAYPCFATEEDLELMRKIQEKQGVRPGYYGKYAKYRDTDDSEILARLNAGEPYVLRFKSPGNYDKRITFKDIMKGEISMPENDLDIVLIKGDGLPMYHFAHLVDDYLMGTTHVLRADEWLSSVPLHIQLFQAMGWKAPKYGHFAPLQKLDNGNRRKLSKRLDPEANVEFFVEKGYPKDAVIEYIINIINAGFEDWRRANPTSGAFEFQMNFNKVSNVAGALFDFQKLHSISKDVIARMTAEKVYAHVLAWAEKYDAVFAAKMRDQKDYMVKIFAIERNAGKKSRKDLIKWEDVPADVSYFFDDSFIRPVAPSEAAACADVSKIASGFAALYDESDDKDAWFSKVKQVAEENGFTADMKAYKENPAAYKGSVADVAKVLRVLITGRDQSPDLYEIMKVLGRARVLVRLKA